MSKVNLLLLKFIFISVSILELNLLLREHLQVNAVELLYYLIKPPGYSLVTNHFANMCLYDFKILHNSFQLTQINVQVH